MTSHTECYGMNFLLAGPRDAFSCELFESHCLMNFNAFEFLDNFALMALAAVLYGIILRLDYPRDVRRILGGIMFGAGAAVSMMDPLRIAPGVIVDLRSLFIGFSGAFLGPVAMVISLTIGAVTRYQIGGIGVVPGIVAMTLAGCSGTLWGYLMRNRSRASIRHMLLLGLMLCAGLLAFLLLPPEIRATAFKSAAPYAAACYILGALLLGTFVERERFYAMRERRLTNEVNTDPLTGLLNRRGFLRAFDVTQEEGGSENGAAILLIDLDHFKILNDTYGHDAGDLVLQSVGATLRKAVRQSDLLGRLGGEEFAVYLPNASMTDARNIAERIRAGIEASIVASNGSSIKASTSIGGCWSLNAMDLTTGLKRADVELYKAKQGGRNQVRFTPTIKSAA